MSQAQPLSAPSAPVLGPHGVLESDRACVRCGYNLRGLQTTGLCPECGSPVADSLRGKLLKYCADEYLAGLHRGVFLIQTAIIVQILMLFILIGATFAFPGAVTTLNTVGSLVALGVSAASLYGWWLFSELDPGYTGQDAGTTPRKVVRLAVVVQAVAAVVDALAVFLVPATAGTAGATGLSMIEMVIAGVTLIAEVALYFASMLYIQWLAARVPNEKARKRAKTLMWLGPLLMTVGLLLFGLGPLIALVLYWNLLDWVRKDLKRIRAGKQAGAARA